jgi:hypothetical protein
LASKQGWATQVNFLTVATGLYVHLNVIPEILAELLAFAQAALDFATAAFAGATPITSEVARTAPAMVTDRNFFDTTTSTNIARVAIAYSAILASTVENS